jgi:DNA-binding CsgD family transcriptional regulator
MDRLRGDQVRKTLLLVAEAREIGSLPGRRLHLLEGAHRILGAAMTSIGTFRNLRPGGRGSIEEEVTTPGGHLPRSMSAPLERGLEHSPGMRAILQQLGPRTMVTRRRRDVLADGAWYRSKTFNEIHRPNGFDDFVYSVRTIGSGRAVAMAIRREAGDRPFDEEDRNLLDVLHEEVARLDARERREGPRVTAREAQVLDRLLTGASEKEVAADLAISPQTVHSHVKSIYRAHGVSSRAALLARCLSR